MIMIFMIPMNLHRGHGVGVALGQVLQGAVVPVCETRIIKVSLTIVHDHDHNDHNYHDGCVHVDIAVSQNESAGLLLETHYENWVLPVQLSPGAATAGSSTS